MVEIDDYIPETIRRIYSWKTNDELIRKTKLKYLSQISVMPSGGTSVIENLTEFYDIHLGDVTDWVGDLADKLSLRDVYYYFTYILTCKCNTYILQFEKEKKKLGEYKENIKKLDIFNEYGMPIWDQSLTFSPKLWVGNKEDDKLDHVSLLFISSGTPVKYFDIITHDVKTINKPGLVRCRIHLDNGLMEMSLRDFPDDKIDEILGFVNKSFGLNPLKPIEITELDIRTFDSHNMVKQTTHEKREGEETTTSLTRNAEDGDTRKDIIRKNIDAREFMQENGVIEVSGENVTVYVKRGKWGSIQYSRYLNPDIQIRAFHKLKQIFGW
jgi:hypothetical protein